MSSSCSPLLNDHYRLMNLDSMTFYDPEKVRYKVIGVEMKGMESSMKLVELGATQSKG